jgi:erythromycin esterase-like protein
MRYTILVLIAAAGCGSSSGTAPDAIPDAGLPVGVTTMSGTDPTLAPDDLAPLHALIGEATFIGLGESIHTSGGYYAMKRRLIEDLIANWGLRVFAMETPHTAAQSVEAYLEGNGVDTKTALRGIFPVFVDDNTLALFTWIAAWNQQHPTDRVRFFGFDAQQPADDIAQLTSFFQAAAPADSARLLGEISTCQRVESGPTGHMLPYAAPDYDHCTQGLDILDTYVAEHRAELEAASDERTVALAELAAISFRSWQGESYYYSKDIGRSYEVRDVAMHAIFARLRDLDYVGQRIIIWMHNYHLTADHPAVTGDDTAGVKTFGTELHAEVGDRYAPVALVGYDVGINWPGIGDGPQPPPDAGALETTLHGLGQSYLTVDPKAAIAGPAPVELNGWNLIAADQYRALVYLDHSPGMNAVYW